MLDNLLLLAWKNWLLQWRHPIQLLVHITLPLLFCVFLIMLRNLFVPTKRNTIIFPEYALNEEPSAFNTNAKLSSLIWSPCNNSALEGIMDGVVQNRGMSHTCVKNSFELNIILQSNISHTFAGVDFGDYSALVNNLSKEVVVTLRFPAELRTSKKVDKTTFNTWHTDLLYPRFPIPGPRNYTDSTGADPNYYKEGFITLQHDISKEILKYHLRRKNKNVTDFPEIIMRRFPHPSWIEDEGSVAIRESIGASFFFMFIPIIMSTVKDVTEKQLKGFMKIVGVSSCFHWIAWFLNTLAMLLVIMALVVVFFKVPIPTILPYTSPILLYVLLVLYAAAIISFCFLVSVFFSNVKTAMIAALVFWYVTFVPFTVLQNKVTDICTKLFAMLGLNAAMGFGFRLIMIFEAVGEGLQFNNLLTSPNPTENLTMGHVITMLAFDALFYFVLAVYLEGLFSGPCGIRKVWYYPCIGHGNDAVEGDRRIPESDTYQRGPIISKASIRLRKLTKSYHNQTVAVQNLSMDMFENQITVLLGHKGAGKSTTMSMLTGAIPPTSGTAIINGYNVTNNTYGIRRVLGFCPQQLVLFDDLTVREHIYFFSKLKRVSSGEEIKEEIERYLEVLDLTDEKNTRSKYLSGGMKRKLSVAIALCGNPKVCLLDEPTAGLDSVSRKLLWNFIRSLRKDRTIVITTNSTEEADYIGDRIAILSSGKLQCYGSNSFLKQKYGAGYQVVIEKKANCDSAKLADFIKRYTDSVKVVKNTAFEVTYLLDKIDSDGFSRILQGLEASSAELHIGNVEIAMSTLEEVFMRIRSLEEEEVNADRPRREIDTEKTVVLEKVARLTGYGLKQNQFVALVIKKATLNIRSWIMLVTLTFLPVCFLVLYFLISESRKLGMQSKLKISLEAYDNPVTVVSTANPNNGYYLRYLKILYEDNRRVIKWGFTEMGRKILEQATISAIDVRKKYIIGSSFSNETNEITAWFNNQPYHSSPLSLQYVMNAILQEKLSSEHHKIKFVHYPLPFSEETKIMHLEETSINTLEIPVAVGIGIAIVSGLYVIFCIEERISKSKHLQFVSGVDIYLYWLSNYLWDLCTFLVASVCVIITLIALGVEAGCLSVVGPLFMLFTLFGLAMLPAMYILSRFFQAPASAFAITALLNMLLGPITFMVYHTFSNSGLGPKVVYNIFHWISLVVPHYALTSGMYELSFKSSLNSLCSSVNEKARRMIGNVIPDEHFACRVNHKCCGIDEKYLGWQNHGIGKNLCFLTIIAVLLVLILLATEYRLFHTSKRRRLPPDDSLDYDVVEESKKVRTGEVNPKNHYVVLHNLTKFFRKQLVVNQLCFGVKRWECFGLLGVHGAGKTITFRMLTGDISMSNGNAWLYGWNTSNNTRRISKYIGYCPQVDPLLDNLTGKETLALYCMLRGISFSDSKVVALALAKELEFDSHIDQLVKHYSGCTKRKLSLAIALTGDPPILLLDEPSTGMDPTSKRKLWNILINKRNNGKCIVLLSHSMEECEALCTRLAIMVNGTLKCLGTPRYLKQKFSLGYTLIIKMKIPDHKSELDDADVRAIVDFVESNVPRATLNDFSQNVLTFFIINKRMKWSVVFALMETAKTSFNIDEYTISQSSLEQMFLNFTKLQIND